MHKLLANVREQLNLDSITTPPLPPPKFSCICIRGEKDYLYLLARMTMSIPQNILMIQPTITIAVRI